MVFKVIYGHLDTKDLSNGLYDELNYAKFLSEPHADPMNLVILTKAFTMLYEAKYKKEIDLSK